MFRLYFVSACICIASGALLKPLLLHRPQYARVFVSDFLDGFPGPAPSLRSLGLTMGSIYGRATCPGDAAFLGCARDAPASFCRRENLQRHMSMRPDLDFDQFALERVMLAKWLASPRTCADGDSDCQAAANIVVVPSMTLHQMVQLGFNWNVVHGAAKDVNPLDDSRRYWDAVRAKFHNPERGYTPLVVVHFSFVPDSNGIKALVHALAEQPVSFVQRVAIPGIESNIKKSDQARILTWGKALVLNQVDDTKSKSTGPLFLTMPYPTSLLEAVPFTEDDGAYSASKPRDVVVSLLTTEPSVKSGMGRNWIREIIWDEVAAKSTTSVWLRPSGNQRLGDHPPKVYLACSDAARSGPNCGLGMPNMWSLAVNSAFCVEPAGDTLTRSHFYLAVLSGCIPVIFDGGHDSYKPQDATSWAWRRRSHDQRGLSLDGDFFGDGVLEYESFSVIYKAEDVKRGKVDVMTELLAMPKEQPTRFQSLRQNLTRVAPLMRYSKDPCSLREWGSRTPWACRDAFTAAQQLLVLYSKGSAV